MAEDVVKNKEEQAFGGLDTDVNVIVHGKTYGVKVDIPRNSTAPAKPYVAHVYEGTEGPDRQDLVNVAYLDRHNWRVVVSFRLGDPDHSAGRPENTVKPSISGDVRKGATLTAEPGMWKGDSLEYAYQWRRSDAKGEKWEDIAGETNKTYELKADDVDQRLRVAVTATPAKNGNRAAAAISDPTVVVTAP